MRAPYRIPAMLTAGFALVVSLSTPTWTRTVSPQGLHEPFDTILMTYVNEGVVDYKGLKGNEKDLDDYLAVLDSTDPAALDPSGRIAFWINAYNAFTLKLILNHYPGLEGIKDIPSSKRWKASIWRVNGREYSLDDIEHKILRKMGEPRIHFALVCASYSCPDLRGEAYLPERLNEQLDDATRRFLANSEKGLQYREEEGTVWGMNYYLILSSIFDWFEGDFEGSSGSVVEFIFPFLPDGAREFVIRHRDDLKVRHLDYDWKLNGE